MVLTSGFTVEVSDGEHTPVTVSVDTIPISPAQLISTPFDVAVSAIDVAVSPDGARTYVVNLSGTVTVLDTTTVIGEIPVGAQPRALALSPDGSLAYVVNYEDGTRIYVTHWRDDTVTVISLVTLTGAATAV